MRFRLRRTKSLFGRKFLIIGMVMLFVAIVAGGWAVYGNYRSQLKPVSSINTEVYFTIETGQTTKQVAKALKDQGLIRSSSAFEWYIRNRGDLNKVIAGTYLLSPSMSTQQIIAKIISGQVARNLFTILPGKRLDQVKQSLIEAGYTKDQVDGSLDPTAYQDHPSLQYLPKGASLEGYLYPDSYERLAQTPVSGIINAALDEMDKKLTASLVTDLGKQGLNVNQAIILASIVAQEVSDPAEKPIVAQVFLKRFNEGMMLGSDVTAFYAAAIAHKEASVFIDSPYNTRLYKGLPPGPIGTVTIQDLNAIAHPASTDFLYFVAGDDGSIHYSHTEAEHNALVKKYCTQLCGQ